MRARPRDGLTKNEAAGHAVRVPAAIEPERIDATTTAGASPRHRPRRCASRRRRPEDRAIDHQVRRRIGAFDQHREAAAGGRREGLAPSAPSNRAPAATGNVAAASGPSSKSSVTVTSVAAPWLNIDERRRGLAGAAHLALGEQPARRARGRAAAAHRLVERAVGAPPLGALDDDRRARLDGDAERRVRRATGAPSRRRSSGGCSAPACRTGSRGGRRRAGRSPAPAPARRPGWRASRRST